MSPTPRNDHKPRVEFGDLLVMKLGSSTQFCQISREKESFPASRSLTDHEVQEYSDKIYKILAKLPRSRCKSGNFRTNHSVH